MPNINGTNGKPTDNFLFATFTKITWQKYYIVNSKYCI